MNKEVDLEDKLRNVFIFSFLVVAIILIISSAYIDNTLIKYLLIISSVSTVFGGFIYSLSFDMLLYKRGAPIIPSFNPDINCAREQYKQIFRRAKSHIQMITGLSPKFYNEEMKKEIKKALERGVKIDILLDNPKNKDVLLDLTENQNLTIYLLPDKIDIDFTIIDGKKLRVEEEHDENLNLIKADNTEQKEVIEKFENLFIRLWSKIYSKQISTN